MDIRLLPTLDVAAIARNFEQNGFHFAYPQIDWAGDSPGYVGTEFPILPFVAAICYKFVNDMSNSARCYRQAAMALQAKKREGE